MFSPLVFISLFLDSSPNRGRSPVEWGEILSVHPSIHLFRPRQSQPGLRSNQAGLRTSQAGLRTSQAGHRASQLSLRASYAEFMSSQLAIMGRQMDGWTDVENIFLFNRNLFPIRAAALLAKGRSWLVMKSRANYYQFYLQLITNLSWNIIGSLCLMRMLVSSIWFNSSCSSFLPASIHDTSQFLKLVFPLCIQLWVKLEGILFHCCF